VAAATIRKARRDAITVYAAERAGTHLDLDADLESAVHDVIGLLQNGETIDTLTANCFPQLTRSQVYECLAYYEDHRGELDLLVAKQMAAPAPE
jgi:uncharacterized protein (DUF433 family)